MLNSINLRGINLTYIQSTNINTNKKYNSITIGLSSPEMLLARSYGEVLKPETINYRPTNLKKMVCFVKKYLDL